MIRPLLLALLALFPSIQASVICYECYANSTDEGRFCSIDKLCKGTSCSFQLNSDNSWQAGCSDSLSTNTNIACSTTTSSSSSCSCNTDFCNSLAKSESALKSTVSSSKSSWFGSRNNNKTANVSLALPDRNLIHCEECGSVTVANETVVIPCDRNHTCQGNYCVSIRGQSPYSYCGGVWDEEKAPACYLEGDIPEMCVCSNHMCNMLLDPAPIMTTTASLGDPTLATLAPIIIELDTNQDIVTIPSTTPTEGTTATTAKPTTKKKCKTSKLSPNDQAVYMGEKLKNVILGGFGSDDGAVQNFEDDINDHICNYSDDEEE
ncbi:unnamed protein product [Caenorhabditis sp. 36 PRJEB53466]|nr:unnamed protein product [Caenorhabditis sp. 36 PRJEB53466]